MTRFGFGTIRQRVLRLLIVIIGALIAALGYSLFQVPFNIAAGGVGGISIIINYFTGWPIGTLYLVINIPLMFLGFRYLGRWNFLGQSVIAVLVFSVSVNFFIEYLPVWLDQYPLTDDVLLSAIYGGIIGGIGGGFIYRSGATMGGTGIIGRILQQRTGVPLSQTYFYTDGVIIVIAGFIFGWEIALYSLLTLFLYGVASDYTLEGPSSVRTVTIITNRPTTVSKALIEGLQRGVSEWQITGMYTGQSHSMLMCTVYRPQVNLLRQVVAEADRSAFVVIGTAHQAWGSTFTPLKKN